MSRLHILREDSSRNFPPILEKGGIKLSVQGGSGHYCSPRLDLTALDDYNAFEVAIFNKYVGDTDVANEFPTVYDLIEDFEELGNTGNFTYVPKDVVERVVEELERSL